MKLETIIYFLSILLLLFLTSISKISCRSLANNHHKNHHPPPPTSLFIFGDSLLDAGNNNYINTTTLDKANFWPYGITFFHFPTGRFSDGRLIGDFIAERANLPLIAPFLQPGKTRFYDGVNFASAGAGALVQTFQGSVIDLHIQLRNYRKVEKRLRLKLGDAKAKRRLTRAVYLFSIGINDYNTLFLTNSTFLTDYTRSDYVHMVIGNITYVIKEIYKTGGRKFALVNLPPIGCAPGLRMLNKKKSGDCLNEASRYIIPHNRALSQVLKQLAHHLPGFKYSLYDFYTSLL